jgi:small-conductance mechanosensitive channel
LLEVTMPIQALDQTFRVGFPSLDRVLFHVGDTPVTVSSIVLAAIMIVATWVLSRLARRAMSRGLKYRGVTDTGTIAAGTRLVHYLVLLIGALLTFRSLGIDLSTLFAAGAVFAVGLGFALQNITQNFVSGVILLLERSIKPGDVLEVEGRFVRVKSMGIRTTVARTLDEEEIIVPNSTIVQSTVKNYTLGDNLYRLRTEVGVTYGSDMKLVKRVLEQAAHAATIRVAEKEPLVILRDFADSAVVWEVSIWVDQPWRARRLKGALMEGIWFAFKEHGITIAFPQMDVHFDPDLTRSLEAVGKAS